MACGLPVGLEREEVPGLLATVRPTRSGILWVKGLSNLESSVRVGVAASVRVSVAVLVTMWVLVSMAVLVAVFRGVPVALLVAVLVLVMIVMIITLLIGINIRRETQIERGGQTTASTRGTWIFRWGEVSIHERRQVGVCLLCS